MTGVAPAPAARMTILASIVAAAGAAPGSRRRRRCCSAPGSRRRRCGRCCCTSCSGRISRAVRERRRQVVEQQRALGVEPAAGHHPVAVGALRRCRPPPAPGWRCARRGRRPRPTAHRRRGRRPSSCLVTGSASADPVVPGVEGVAGDRRRPHPPADAALPLEDEPRRARHGGEVDDAAAADAVAAEHAHAVADDEVEDPGVGRAELEVVVELVGRSATGRARAPRPGRRRRPGGRPRSRRRSRCR